MHHVLIIEADERFRGHLAGRLRRQRFQVIEASAFDEAMGILESTPVGVVLLGLNDGQRHGLDTLSALLKENAHRKVILLVPEKDVTLSMEGMKRGAYDDVELPFDLRTLVEKIDKALEPEQANVAMSGSA
ncbi:response regulator [Desulfovibrio inopinatus]|uniref:response regulator n=1 Tax=Desulfovibrio inopinatus TaxID=102109 RepID=UPI00042592EC|nr:response regulator [Desulfovibrio inopinatus]